MPMCARLHATVDRLGGLAGRRALDELRWRWAATDRLTQDELAQMAAGEREIAAGESVTPEELKRLLGV